MDHTKGHIREIEQNHRLQLSVLETAIQRNVKERADILSAATKVTAKAVDKLKNLRWCLSFPNFY